MYLPLRDQHEQLGVLWCERFGYAVPESYGDAQGEYTALREGVGVLDVSFLGKLQVTGADRVSYLQGQLTQDVSALGKAGAGAYSCLLKPTGQVLSDMVLFSTSDSILILTPTQTLKTVHTKLEQFVIMEEVEIADRSTEFVVLHLTGIQCHSLLQQTLGCEVPPQLWQAVSLLWQDTLVHLVQTSRTGEPGYDLIAPAQHGQALWQAFLDTGAKPVGWSAYNVRRVEGGIPLFGIDIDESTLPQEAGLQHAISFTKGCYTGQEVVHRVYSRGHTNRSLVGLRVLGDVLPDHRDVINAKDRADAGWVTSAVRSFGLSENIALGYVRNDYTAPGTEVFIQRGDSQLRAEVAELPFVESRRD